MPIKTPPFKHHKAWTTSRFWSFIRSALRRAWMRWPPKYEVMRLASRPYTGTDKRTKKEYQCKKCKEWFKTSQVEVDHVVPAGTLRDYDDLPKFVERLFVGVDKLRVLCKPCHKKITAKEKKK